MGLNNQGQRRFLVTGASGRQGGAVAKQMLAHNIPVSVLTRNTNSAAARALADKGAHILQGDFEDPASLRRALEGISGLFSMQTPYEAGVSQEIVHGTQLADAAKQAGVEQIVYSSVASANLPTGVPHFESKGAIERHTLELKFRYVTILRPTFFMEMFLAPGNLKALARNRIELSFKPATRIAMIAVEDIAAMAVAAFLEPEKWHGAAITLAGDTPDLLEVAAAFSEALARPVSYKEIPLEEIDTDTRPKAGTQKWLEAHGWTVDLPKLRASYPFQAQTIQQWAKENAALLNSHA